MSSMSSATGTVRLPVQRVEHQRRVGRPVRVGDVGDVVPDETGLGRDGRGRSRRKADRVQLRVEGGGVVGRRPDRETSVVAVELGIRRSVE